METTYAKIVHGCQSVAATVIAILPSKAFARYAYAYKSLPTSGSASPDMSDDGPAADGWRQRWTPRLRWSWAAIATLVLLYVVKLGLLSHPEPLAAAAAARAGLTKEQYVDAVLREPIEGIVDLEPIRQRCRAIKPNPGLVWHCEVITGGLGNVGNMWLNCMLFGMEAGATTIILPRLGVRDATDLSDLGDHVRSTALSDLFDVEYFLDVWPQACPHIRVVTAVEDVPELIAVSATSASNAPAGRIDVSKLAGVDKIRNLVVDPTIFRERFDVWLAAYVPASATMSEEQPLRVSAAAPLFQWHRAFHEQPGFAPAFARLFCFARELRTLGGAVLWHLEQRMGTPAVSDAVLWGSSASSSASSPSVNTSLVTHLGPERLLHHSFMGVHLRTANDAAKFHWPGYDDQAPYYINATLAHNLSTVYLATGSPTHRALFVTDAAVHNLTVIGKEDLLAGTPDLDHLRLLSWDQQAVVDLQVLLHASSFIGMGRSSFTWSVALRRSVLPEAGRARVDLGCYERATKGKPRQKGVFPVATSEVGFADDASVVLCDVLMRLANSVWP